MSYDGPSQSEWLAEYRSRRPASEVILHEALLSEPLPALSRSVVSLRISRYDDPDTPNPDLGFYLFTVTEDGNTVTDSWHETLDDALDQAEFEFGISRRAWTPAPDAA